MLLIYLVFLIMEILDPSEFTIQWGNDQAKVSSHTIESARVFHILFPDKRPPLNITIAEDREGVKFWTSIPEGRQAEAEFAGKAIALYIREFRRNHACVTITDKKLAAPSLFD